MQFADYLKHYNYLQWCCILLLVVQVLPPPDDRSRRNNNITAANNNPATTTANNNITAINDITTTDASTANNNTVTIYSDMESFYDVLATVISKLCAVWILATLMRSTSCMDVNSLYDNNSNSEKRANEQ